LELLEAHENARLENARDTAATRGDVFGETHLVGAPVMDEWIFVISAAKAAFVWSARVLAAVMQV
jgi:hypothetical protein